MKYQKIDLEQKSTEWLNYRRTRVMASEMPSIMNSDGAYKSRDQLLSEKISGETPVVSEFLQAKFDLGNQYETIMLDYINTHTRATFAPAVIESIENPRFAASLDGLAFTGQVMEAKTTSSDDIVEGLLRQEIPEIWKVQMDWQGMIAGVHQVYLIVVDTRTGTPLYLTHKVRSENFPAMIERANLFLADLDSGKCPIVTIESDEMIRLAESQKLIKKYEDLIKEEDKKNREIAKRILSENKATKIVGCGISISLEHAKGQIDYKEIPAVKAMTKEFLDKFRKKTSPKLVIRLNKATQTQIGVDSE